METYKQLEAPQDYIQIEQISDMFSECEELKYGNWQNLELSEKQMCLISWKQRLQK